MIVDNNGINEVITNNSRIELKIARKTINKKKNLVLRFKNETRVKIDIIKDIFKIKNYASNHHYKTIAKPLDLENDRLYDQTHFHSYQHNEAIVEDLWALLDP